MSGLFGGNSLYGLGGLGSLTKNYKLFISHMWRGTDNSEYYNMVDMLNSDRGFLWTNYSVPEHDPLQVKGSQALAAALAQQIAPVDCFLVIAGMYAKHRDWIKYEVDLAASYNKPIISVSPWGQERHPVELDRFPMVGWNTSSIVAAIRQHAR